MRTLIDLLLPLITLAPLINWAAFAVLFRGAHQQPRYAALNLAALTSFVLAIASTIFALLAHFYADLATRDRDLVEALGAVAVVALAVPGLVLLLWYFTRARR